MSKKAPFNDLQEISKRKQQLRAKIEVQERRLSKDLDAYDDDVETLKRVWNGLKGIRHFGKNFSLSGITQAVQTVRALPIGKKAVATASKGSRWLSAITLGVEAVGWLVKRWEKRKKSKK